MGVLTWQSQPSGDSVISNYLGAFSELSQDAGGDDVVADIPKRRNSPSGNDVRPFDFRFDLHQRLKNLTARMIRRADGKSRRNLQFRVESDFQSPKSEDLIHNY